MNIFLPSLEVRMNRNPGARGCEWSQMDPDENCQPQCEWLSTPSEVKVRGSGGGEDCGPGNGCCGGGGLLKVVDAPPSAPPLHSAEGGVAP